VSKSRDVAGKGEGAELVTAELVADLRIRFAEAFSGERIVSALMRQLESEYGRGFAEKNLRRMMQFATVFPEEQIVVSLSRQLSWTHFLALIPLKAPLQREFYAEMRRIERWSTRTLQKREAYA
jgi:hypothetical protein